MKMATKREAGFQLRANDPDKRCANCEYFRFPGRCQKVSGGVTPMSSCLLFEQKMTPRTLATDPVAMLINRFPLKVIAEKAVQTSRGPIKEVFEIGLSGIADIAPETLNPLSDNDKIGIGDRVRSDMKVVDGVPKYGGYVTAAIGDRAIVLWDGGLTEVMMVSDLKKVN
jgi:hypothetical protein